MDRKLFEYAEKQADFIIDLQRKMTALPAIGPDNKGQGEAKKAAYLRQVLKELKAEEILTIDALDSRVPGGLRPNIAARLKGRVERTLWVIGHMDVVPAGDLNLWKTPPFELRQDGDWLIGRGVEDNQQAIATGLLAWKSLVDTNTVPDLSYGVIFVSDEETHSAYGLGHVMKKMPALIKPDDLVLIPDIGDKLGANIEIAEKSSIWLKVTVIGKQCHASTPDEGINTLPASSAAVLALSELYEIFPQEDPLYYPAHSTFVPSKKEANVENINTVPGLDVFYVDCRVLPEVSLSDVRNKAEEICRKAVQPYKAGVGVEVIFEEQAPTPTKLDAPVVRRLGRSLKRLRGLEAKPVGAGGQTVAAILRRMGIPVAAWSTIVSNAHAPNERSSIINTISDAKVVLDMLFD